MAESEDTVALEVTDMAPQATLQLDMLDLDALMDSEDMDMVMEELLDIKQVLDMTTMVHMDSE